MRPKAGAKRSRNQSISGMFMSHVPEGGEGLLGGVGELPVAALELLQAFEVGAELVGGFDQGVDVRVLLPEEGGIGGAELLGEGFQEAVCGHGLHLAVGV